MIELTEFNSAVGSEETTLNTSDASEESGHLRIPNYSSGSENSSSSSSD